MRSRDSSQACQARGLSEPDARDLCRILGHTIALPGGHQVKKRLLLDGMRRLLRADGWLCVLRRRLGKSEPTKTVDFLHGGRSHERDLPLKQISELLEHGKALVPLPATTHESPSPVSIVPEGHPLVVPGAGDDISQRHGQGQLGPVMLGTRTLDARSVSAVALFRHPGADPFTGRELMITRLIIDDVPWLHLTECPGSRTSGRATLSPRQRMILELLLKGLSR